MFKNLMETLEAYQRRDPAARSKLEIFLLYQGVHATLYHRLAWTGIEIHPGAKIGRRLVIDHGMGIVIGETAEVGDDCLIYHGVTLGGTGKDQGKRHPTVGNNVLLSCGAKVLGPFHIGDNARIASNAVVLSEVPPDATAVGIPAQIVRIAGIRRRGGPDQRGKPHPGKAGGPVPAGGAAGEALGREVYGGEKRKSEEWRVKSGDVLRRHTQITDTGDRRPPLPKKREVFYYVVIQFRYP